MFVLPLAVQNPNIVMTRKGKGKGACALAVGSIKEREEEQSFASGAPAVCVVQSGAETKTEYSGERSTCDATTADGAQEQRNGNLWVL